MDYQSAKWKKKREKILKLDKYKDRVAAMFGRTAAANTVHHIYPAEEYPEYEWCDWNLISVSQATHNRLENRKTGELTKEGLMLQRLIKPHYECRKI